MSIVNSLNTPIEPRGTDASRVARHIQHTLISNVLTETMWRQHIDECLHYQFHAAMLPGAWVKKTKQALAGTGVRTASFIDFPYGTMTSTGKACEARILVAEGAEEIDLMPNVGFLLSGMDKEYFDDVRGVVAAAENIPVKIMLELPLLTPEQRKRAIDLSVEAGVKYLKNASGGAVGIATPDEIRFLRRAAPAQVGVKASGGIKTAAQVRALIEAGADLVGTSSGARIMQEALSESAAPLSHDTY